MVQALLLDTDLLIDFLRGQRQAVAFMEEETRPMAVSALTAAELHADKHYPMLPEVIVPYRKR